MGDLERAQELGRAVNGHPEAVDAALPELAALLARAQDAQVLAETVQSLGHAGDVRAAALLLPLAVEEHLDPAVRLAVVSSLWLGVEDEPLRSQVVDALIGCTIDPMSSVRDMACFALVMLEADGPTALAALAARLHDEDLDTRCEALLGLARAGDPRALPKVLERLDDDPDGITLLELESAVALADPALLPALERLAQLWAGEQERHSELVALGLRRCAQDAAARAAQVEDGIVAALRDALPWTTRVVLTGSYPQTVLQLARTSGTVRSDRLWISIGDCADPFTINAAQLVATVLHQHALAGASAEGQ